MDWYVAIDNQPKLMPQNVLIYKIENDEISGETLVVNENIKNWIPLKRTDLWKIYERKYTDNSQQHLVNNYSSKPYSDSNYYSQCDNGQKGLILAIIGIIFSILGLFILPFIFSVLGFVFGLIVSIITYSEENEMFKPVWKYRNKARGLGITAATLGAVGIILIIVNNALLNSIA